MQKSKIKISKENQKNKKAMVSKAKVWLAKDYLAMNNKKAKYNIEVLLQGKYHGPTKNGYISISGTKSHTDLKYWGNGYQNGRTWDHSK